MLEAIVARLINAGVERRGVPAAVPAGFPNCLASDIYKNFDMAKFSLRVEGDRVVRLFADPPWQTMAEGAARWVIVESDEEDRVLLRPAEDPGCPLEFYDVGAQALYSESGARLSDYLLRGVISRRARPVQEDLSGFVALLCLSDWKPGGVTVQNLLRQMKVSGVVAEPAGSVRRYIVENKGRGIDVELTQHDENRVAATFANEADMLQFIAVLPKGIAWKRDLRRH